MVTQRESLHVRVLDALGQLATHHEQRGGYRESLAYARRQIELEPWRESAHRQTMRALALGGQRATAMAQYESCVRILEEELGIEPEAATRDLYAQIRRGELGSPLSPESAPLAQGPTDQAWSTVDQAAMSDRSIIPGQRPPGPVLSRSGAPPQRIEEDGTRSGLLSGGERRTVTFLLAETSGIERPVAGADLEMWAETWHEVLEGARGAVMHYGGTIVQTYDAGFVAAFGADVAHEDDARRAVLAALSIMRAVTADETLDSRQGEVRGQALTVGVNTGEAIILARAHGGVAAHATVIDQLRDIREQILPGTVWVGEVTYRHVAEQFAWTRLGEVADTKRDTVVRLYSPVAAVPTPAEHAVGGLRVPLVGRGAELVALTAAIVRLQAGIGGVVTVVGEAGIGKSRLIAEARSRAIGDDASDNAHRAETSSEASDRTSALRWVEGQWLSYTEGTAYYGWQELLRRLLGLSESCTLATCEALEEEVRAHCPDRADEITPYLRRLLALPEDAETAASLDRLVPTGMLRNAIFQAVTTLLTSVARRVPLVAVLDDLHWADGASLALLEHVLALTDQVPMLVIIAMRPARTHGSWHVRETAMREYGHRHTDLSLGPLQPIESEALVRSYLQAGGRGSGVDVNLVKQVQQRAEGNPFFAAEIVRSLVDEGAMIERPPATIEGVLTARIDRLPLEARRVLQLAAVMGRIFSYDLLLDIVSGEEPGFREGLLNGALLELLRAQLIRSMPAARTLLQTAPRTGSSPSSISSRWKRLIGACCSVSGECCTGALRRPKNGSIRSRRRRS